MIATRRDRAGGQLSRNHWLLGGLTTGHMVNDFYALILPPLLPAVAPVFGLNYFQSGLLAFCFYILSGVLQPTLGHLSDKHAWRKKILISGFLINCVGFVAMGLSPSYPLLMVSSLFCGLGAATFHPQSTNFLSRAFPEHKGWALGVHGWGGSIGNFVAPMVVAGLVSWVGWRLGLMFLVVPGILISLLLWRLLDEPADVKAASFGNGITGALVLVSITFALQSMVMRGFLTFLPTFLVDEHGSSLARAGFITSIMLFVGIIAQPLGGYVYDRVGGRVIFFVCAMATAVSLFAFTLSSGIMLIVWTAVIGFFVFALFPVSLAMGSEIAKDNRVGMSVGIIFGASSTMSAVTPVLSGYVGDRLGLNFSFQLLVIFAVLAALLSLGFPRRQKT